MTERHLTKPRIDARCKGRKATVIERNPRKRLKSPRKVREDRIPDILDPGRRWRAPFGLATRDGERNLPNAPIIPKKSAGPESRLKGEGARSNHRFRHSGLPLPLINEINKLVCSHPRRSGMPCNVIEKDGKCNRMLSAWTENVPRQRNGIVECPGLCPYGSVPTRTPEAFMKRAINPPSRKLRNEFVPKLRLLPAVAEQLRDAEGRRPV
jgi:hypothetical protein